MELDYKYTAREKELLAIIGEAYLGLEGPDEGYYRNRLRKAEEELEELQEELAEKLKVVVYVAYKYKDEDKDDINKEFKTKAEAIKYCKANKWDEVLKFVFKTEAYYYEWNFESVEVVWEI